MSEGQNNAAGDVGLALLLGGGVADAIAGVEATLATVQGAAARVLSGLARVQAVGAAAATVPPAPPQVQPQAAATETSVALSLLDPSAERFALPPTARPAGPEQVAAFAPASVPGGGSVVPAPAPFVSEAAVPWGSAAPMRSDAPVPSLPDVPARPAAPILLAAFAPTATAALPAKVAGAGDIDAPDAGAQWNMAAPSQEKTAWPSPAAPIAVPDAGAAAPRGNAAAATPTQQSGPTGGDVFLDGTRVGTWLADHLAREAGRPQGGGTEFDPRLTPAWPGTLQGN